MRHLGRDSKTDRDAAIVRWHQRGMDIETLVRVFGVQPVRVRRILRRAGCTIPDPPITKPALHLRWY